MPKKRIFSDHLFERNKSKVKIEKQKNTLRILLSVFAVLGLLLLFVYVYVILNVSPKDSLSLSAKQLLTIPRQDLESTLVVFEGQKDRSIDGAWYVVHNKKNAFTMVYSIPSGVYMKDYLGAVSSYVSVGELKYVGNRIDSKREIEYAIWQLGNLTGMTPDSYIWLSLESQTEFNKIFKSTNSYKKSDFESQYINGSLSPTDSFKLNAYFNNFNFVKFFLNFNKYSTFIKNIDTNMKTYELLNRMDSIKSSLEGSDIFMLDLSQTWATVIQKQISGKDVNVVNYSEVDQMVGTIVKNLKGRELEREQVKIEIYNASEVAGLASRYSRKFQNSGIEVVRFENAPTQEDVTKVFVTKPEIYSNSLEVVKKLLALEPEVILRRPDFMTTGDIVVILGKDLGRQVEWK